MALSDSLPIFYENGLRDVIKTYNAAFGRKNWQLLWPFNALAFMVTFACFVFGGLPPEQLELLKYVDNFANAYIGIGIGAFGMILAGFAIVFSALDPQLTKALAHFPFRQSGRPTYNVFLSIFIFGLSLALATIIAGVLFYAMSLVLSAEENAPETSSRAHRFFLSTAWLTLSFQVAGLVYVLSSIKGFVMSLHQVMLFIADAKVALGEAATSLSPPAP